MRVFGLVTARGGSKRLPRKNLLPVAGRPLIAWTLQAARQATRLDRVIVSTDDPEIASVCRAAGAEVPFLRPAALAGDRASHDAVVDHAVRWLLADEPAGFDLGLLLQPTTPLRTAADIDGIIAFAAAAGAESVVSVCPTPHHPYLAYSLDDAGHLRHFHTPPDGYLRTQDMPPAYVLNGALFLFQPQAMLARGTLLGPRVLMPPSVRSTSMATRWPT